MEPRWVTRVVVDAIHLDQIREHGGLGGLRDENGLEAALARPQQKWHYEPRSTMAELAAAYGFELSRSHPYRDGSKRVAFVAMVVFLGLNGWPFAATEVDVVEAMTALAAGTLTEKDLAVWLAERCRKSKGRGASYPVLGPPGGAPSSSRLG